MANVAFGISLATTSKDMVFYGGNFGSEIMRLKGTGSIGIGTASPSSIFHIYGAAPSLIVQANASSGVNANPSIFLNTIQGGVGFKFYFDGAATGSTYFDNYYTGGSMIFRTQVSSTTPITAMTIKNNANISMGNKLSVAGSLASGSVQTEDILSLTRGDAGPSWPEMVSFKLGRHTAGTLAPRSRLDINLKSTADSNFTADVNVMTLTDAGNVGIGTTNPGYTLDVKGTSTISGVSSQAGYNIDPVTKPTAPTYTLSSGGSVNVGTHYYFVTYTTAIGETNAGTNLAVTTTLGNQTVNLTIPTSTDPRVTGRKIYRTVVGGTVDWEYYLATVSDNTSTTYVDTIADASLTGAPGQSYRVNSTSKYLICSLS